MRELPQKQTPGILSAPMQRMKMHGLDSATPSQKPKAARKKKQVAENITEEYLRRRIDKQIGIAADADPTDETFGGMVKKNP